MSKTRSCPDSPHSRIITGNYSSLMIFVYLHLPHCRRNLDCDATACLRACRENVRQALHNIYTSTFADWPLLLSYRISSPFSRISIPTHSISKTRSYRHSHNADLSFLLMDYASVLHGGWSKGCYYTEKVGRMKTARWVLYVYTYTSPNRFL